MNHVLVVDNHRNLHGRTSWPLDTVRCLNRLWLESGGGLLNGSAATNGISLIEPVPSASSAMEQITSWRLGAVLAETSQGSPLGTYLTGLLGKPTVVTADVLGWRLSGKLSGNQ